MKTSQHNSELIFKLLVESGIDVTAKNKKGREARYYQGNAYGNEIKEEISNLLRRSHPSYRTGS